MAAYNAAAHVGRAVESVLAQSVPVDEIIVVDDGSTDGTAEAVSRYARAVRCVSLPANQGAPSARNVGIGEARSEWVSFLDSDDEWLPHMVEAQRELTRRSPDLRWSFCNVRVLRGGAAWNGHVPRDLQREARRSGRLDFFAAYARKVPFGVGGVFIHRSVFADVGLFDPALRRGEDRDMWWRIAMKHPLVGFTPDPGFQYHKDTPGSLSKGAPNRDLELSNVLLNMRRAQALGPEVASRAFPAFRNLAAGYALRAAARSLEIRPELLSEAARLLPLRPGERLLAGLLRALPRSVALKLPWARAG
jgi:glycosyltransferase involved in cell wall biosynthesis